MLKTTNKLAYKAFGLSINSEILLPELPLTDSEDVGRIDIEIKIGYLSELWSELSNSQYDFVINENLIMFQVPNVAIFLMEEGSKITVSPLDDFDEDKVRLYLLGTCMGAILLQKKILPLHGSAIAIDGKAYAIIGDSGAGKSTLASALLQEGYPLLSDDVIAVSVSEDRGTPIVTPAYPHQKLWQDSLNIFGLESTNYDSIFGRETKYSIPVTQYYNKPLPLGAIFVLEKYEEESVDISEIQKLERFYDIYTHTFRNFLIPNLGLMDWHLNITAQIVNQIKIYRIKRPNKGCDTKKFVSLFINTIKKGD